MLSPLVMSKCHTIHVHTCMSSKRSPVKPLPVSFIEEIEAVCGSLQGRVQCGVGGREVDDDDDVSISPGRICR